MNQLLQWEISHHLLSDDDNQTSEVIVTNKHNSNEHYSFFVPFVKNIPYLRFCNESRWLFLNENIKYREDDILIVSYPKCGTTWTEQCILLLLAKGDITKLDPQHKNSYDPNNTNHNKLGKIWPEAMIEQNPIAQTKMLKEGQSISWEQFDQAPSPRVIKSHAPIELLLGSHGNGLKDLPKNMKIIIVTRNPLDACVSSYYHSFNPAKSGWPFDAWASAWYHGLVPHGSYFSWVKNWRKEYETNLNRTFWLEYETMKENPIHMIEQLAQYLGMTEISSDLLEKVALESSFESMKNQVKEQGGDLLGHLRKGQVGDWQNHFSLELVELFQKHYENIFSS